MRSRTGSQFLYYKGWDPAYLSQLTTPAGRRGRQKTASASARIIYCRYALLWFQTRTRHSLHFTCIHLSSISFIHLTHLIDSHHALTVHSSHAPSRFLLRMPHLTFYLTPLSRALWPTQPHHTYHRFSFLPHARIHCTPSLVSAPVPPLSVCTCPVALCTYLGTRSFVRFLYGIDAALWP
jgi:hypothetical protein